MSVDLLHNHSLLDKCRSSDWWNKISDQAFNAKEWSKQSCSRRCRSPISRVKEPICPENCLPHSPLEKLFTFSPPCPRFDPGVIDDRFLAKIRELYIDDGFLRFSTLYPPYPSYLKVYPRQMQCFWIPPIQIFILEIWQLWSGRWIGDRDEKKGPRERNRVYLTQGLPHLKWQLLGWTISVCMQSSWIDGVAYMQ